MDKIGYLSEKNENKKAGAEYRVIFRQPGCLGETRRLSAPFLRMVEYYRLSRKQFVSHGYHFNEVPVNIFPRAAVGRPRSSQGQKG
jgi:hypothetical protein